MGLNNILRLPKKYRRIWSSLVCEETPSTLQAWSPKIGQKKIGQISLKQLQPSFPLPSSTPSLLVGGFNPSDEF